ncbi:MAG: hypothetical protein EBR30_18945 [Cytophagia bacterium]|nr:hypothetical protein [Cytophagia bacterium]NBW37059.1 hypothetical protein [Cytophagia bacterium]
MKDNLKVMKNIMYCMSLMMGMFLSLVSLAQETTAVVTRETILAERKTPVTFDKKLRFGLSWNQYWGTIKGSNLPEEYFAKPCVGASLRVEYYPLSFIGIGAGFGVQQRGAGIINQDLSGGSFTHPWEGINDPDSTYRERLRMNTIEVPITLLLRTPKDIIKGVRLSGAIGVVFIKNDYVKNFFHVPEDGFHVIADVSNDYVASDLGYQASLGFDIDAAESCVFQVQALYTKGTKNIYKTGTGNGQVETYGVRVAWLF